MKLALEGVCVTGGGYRSVLMETGLSLGRDNTGRKPLLCSKSLWRSLWRSCLRKVAQGKD